MFMYQLVFQKQTSSFLEDFNFTSPFPTYRRILTHLQQTTFDKIVTKGEIAQNKQFLLLPQCFQLCPVIIPTLIEIFHIFLVDIFKVVCCRFVVWETFNFKNIFKSCTNISLHEGGKFTLTFLMKAAVVSGYSSKICSNLGNLCLASMEFSLMAFSRQTVTVSGNCFTHELPMFSSSVT